VTKDELVTKVYEEWSVFYVYESKSI
jgi:hypothetical protein